MKQSDCFRMAKTKRPKRKMVLAAYNRQKILPRYPVDLKLYRKKKLENLKWFRRLQAILSFTIFVKNSKIENGCHFWKEEKILKFGQSVSLRYLVAQKFR